MPTRLHGQDLDSQTGQRFATFETSKPASFRGFDRVAPDLSYNVARGDGTWDIRPLPSPDALSPEASVAQVLEAAGLGMDGVELVYAAPK